MGGRQTPGFNAKTTNNVREGVMSALRSHFRPEFLNRIDEIIIFDALDKAQIEAIVRLQLDRVASTAQGQDIELVFDESLVKHLSSEGYQPEYGARELRRQIRNLLETKLAKAMLKGDIKEGNRVVCSYDEGNGKEKETEEDGRRTQTPCRRTARRGAARDVPGQRRAIGHARPTV